MIIIIIRPPQKQMRSHDRHQHRHLISKPGILRITIIDLSARDPAVGEQMFVVLVLRVFGEGDVIDRFDHQKGDGEKTEVVEVEFGGSPFGRGCVREGRVVGAGSESGVERFYAV